MVTLKTLGQKLEHLKGQLTEAENAIRQANANANAIAGAIQVCEEFVREELRKQEEDQAAMDAASRFEQ